ncbi:MAG: type ISP restriction/modification enzyme [Promethearchaeota archaeon]
MEDIITTSQELSKNLAQIAINIRGNVHRTFSKEEESGHFHYIFQEIKSALSDNLTLESFADMYAQTVTLGLFSLRTTQSKEFCLDKILSLIPKVNPFLNRLLRFSKDQIPRMSLEDLGIHELVQILKNVDIDSVIWEDGKNKNIEDPIIRFYEEFLEYYDPSQKINRGVFYTPDTVVSFIVRSVNLILQTHFNCKDGLADESYNIVNGEKIPKVQILDPTTGTGTFLSHIIDLTYNFFKKKHNTLNEEIFQQNWNSYVSNNLLSRLFAFELLIAPYTIAHYKLGLKLRETGYTFQNQARLGIYLANTLEGSYKRGETLITDSSLSRFFSKEAEDAYRIKMNFPISVVIGNPPYSGHSANNSQWIDDLLRGRVTDETRISNYFEVDGKPLGEKNPKWLNDDYVKFIRFGQWRIEKTGYGILAFITNHSFLDNPTFRGMRQQLMRTFTDIFILDLHGNARRKEKCPDGSKDENVFDIQQGACISFFIKNPNKSGDVDIFKFDLWGLRENKYEFLKNNDILTIDWKKIDSFSPWYMFYQLEMKRWVEYKSGWKITDIFPIYSVGIMTGQDQLTIQYTPEKVKEIVEDLILLPEDCFRKKHNLMKDKRQWALEKSVYDLREHGLNKTMTKIKLRNCIEKNIVPIHYRPFEIRYTFYTGKSRGFHERPRNKVMKHMITGENLGLIVSRNSRPAPWRDIQITEDIIELGVMATRPGNNAPIFPLFLFKKTRNGLKREINFSKRFKMFIEEKFKINNNPSAKDIVYYVYAILHSKEYRKRYENFLKIDFPRILFPNKLELFYELKEMGSELIDLHLLKPERLNDHKVRLGGNGNTTNTVIKRVRYTSDNRIRINENQYFKGVPKEVYSFYIGGYQVCQKWLKDHKNITLTENDVNFFGKIVKVIQETIILMEEIDNKINEYQGWPDAFFLP